jgi:hypothetical protein
MAGRVGDSVQTGQPGEPPPSSRPRIDAPESTSISLILSASASVLAEGLDRVEERKAGDARSLAGRKGWVSRCSRRRRDCPPNHISPFRPCSLSLASSSIHCHQSQPWTGSNHGAWRWCGLLAAVRQLTCRPLFAGERLAVLVHLPHHPRRGRPAGRLKVLVAAAPACRRRSRYGNGQFEPARQPLPDAQGAAGVREERRREDAQGSRSVAPLPLGSSLDC